QFTGCSHRSEKGCAVRAAVEAGEIDKTRYASYVALYEEASETKDWERQ
ncbi:MAG: ribosome small subunit-dependent GTPase A, partial [Ruthenibacterium sp.]